MENQASRMDKNESITLPLKNLDELLKQMEPRLIEGEFVFASLSKEEFHRASLNPKLVFKEDEDVTVIIKKEEAYAKSLPYSEVWKMITLSVHSSLTAVGFLAAVTTALAEKGISVNAVPAERAEEALEVLQDLALKRG